MVPLQSDKPIGSSQPLPAIQPCLKRKPLPVIALSAPPGATPRAATHCQVLPRREPDTYNIVRAVLERANGDVWVGATKGGTAVWKPDQHTWLSLSA